jgi:hypothetical protein
MTEVEVVEESVTLFELSEAMVKELRVLTWVMFGECEWRSVREWW